MFRLTHIEAFEESWEVLKDNLVLFIPNVFMIVVSLVLGFGFFWLSGLYDLFEKSATVTDWVAYEWLLAFLSENWAFLVVLFLVYFVLLFLSDIFFSLSKYGMIKDVIAKRSSLLKDGFQFARKHFFSSVLVHLFSVFFVLLPLVAIGIVLSELFTSITLIALFSIFAVLYKFLAIFRLFMPYPVMAFERAGGFQSIRTDIHYLKTQMGHLFISWLVIIGVTYIITHPITREIAFMGFLMIIFVLFEMLLSTWEQLYILEAHISKKSIKKTRR